MPFMNMHLKATVLIEWRIRIVIPSLWWQRPNNVKNEVNKAWLYEWQTKVVVDPSGVESFVGYVKNEVNKADYTNGGLKL